MAPTPFTFIVIGEDCASHDHGTHVHHKGEVDDLLRLAVNGWLVRIPVPDPDLFVWRYDDRRPMAGCFNPVGGFFVARLGGLSCRWWDRSSSPVGEAPPRSA